MRRTIIRPWEEAWAARYAEEAGKLQQVLGDQLTAIYHIGSTSVAAIGYAKPIIDIMPVVADIQRVEAYSGRLAAIGYEARGENGIAGRRYFTKGGSERTHHVHIVQEGSPEIYKHLVFRAYLRAHPDAARAYGELKVRLAAVFPHDVHHYQDGKGEMMAQLLDEAMEWDIVKQQGGELVYEQP